MIPLQEPELAVIEAERAVVKLGHRGLFISPHPVDKRNLDHPAYGPLWDLAEQLNVPALVHVSTGIRLPTAGGERFDRYCLFHLHAHPMEQMTAAASLILGGVLERHPRLACRELSVRGAVFEGATQPLFSPSVFCLFRVRGAGAPLCCGNNRCRDARIRLRFSSSRLFLSRRRGEDSSTSGSRCKACFSDAGRQSEQAIFWKLGFEVEDEYQGVAIRRQLGCRQSSTSPRKVLPACRYFLVRTKVSLRARGLTRILC